MPEKAFYGQTSWSSTQKANMASGIIFFSLSLLCVNQSMSNSIYLCIESNSWRRRERRIIMKVGSRAKHSADSICLVNGRLGKQVGRNEHALKWLEMRLIEEIFDTQFLEMIFKPFNFAVKKRG
jgi:hypothetical protein